MVDRSDWWRPSDAGAVTADGARPAVRVLLIAAPATPTRPNYGLAFAAAALTFFGLGSLYTGLKARPVFGWAMPLLLAQAGVCAYFAWQLGRAFWKEFRAIQRHEPEASAGRESGDPLRGPVGVDDAIAQAILRKWTHPDSPPKPTAAAEAARRIDPQTSGAARLICLNVHEIPAADDYRFEPEIFPPIRSLSFFLGFAAAGAAVVAAWAMQFVPGVPWKFSLWNVPCFVIPAFVCGVMSLWALWIRPQYVRCAPGVIQVLRYSWRGGPPVVRSYPMLAGTLVVATRKGKELSVALFRDGLKDTLAVAEMTRAKEAEEIVWKALRSTAPIPPLNEAELVG